MSSTTRPYRSLAFTPDIVTALAESDPHGLLKEATKRSTKVLSKAVAAIAKAQAAAVISSTPVAPAPIAETPKPKQDRAKYPRLADGTTVSEAAQAMSKAAYKGGSKDFPYAKCRDLILAAQAVGTELTVEKCLRFIGESAS